MGLYTEFRLISEENIEQKCLFLNSIRSEIINNFEF